MHQISKIRKISVSYFMCNICLRNFKVEKFLSQISRTQNKILSFSHKSRLQAQDGMMFNLIQKFMYASLIGFVKTVECTETPIDLRIFEKSKTPQEKELNYISQSDEYFKLGNYEDSYKILQYFDGHENAEILWRMARCLYNMSKLKNVEHSEQVKMIEEAYELITRALILDENNAAVHKWMAILLDTKFTYEGLTARLKSLPDFKKHLLRSLELNPKDATSMYILGQYCYNIANMPWYQRKIASTLFATPPEATFEEALHYFIMAEEIEPNFYSLNLLMLGKTYLQLKKIEAARYWLKCASSYPIRTEEDKQVRKEAEELLKKHQVKYDNNSFGVREKAKGLKTPQFQAQDSAKPTSVEIPLWLALMITENLETENIFQLKMPKLFKNINTDMVETSACAFNLFRINEHFYEYGIYLCLLDLKGNELIEYIIDKTFCARLEMLLDWARSGLPEPNKIRCLDTTEQMLLKCSNKARIRYDKWLEKGSSRIIQDEHFDDLETVDNIVTVNHSENVTLSRKDIEDEEQEEEEEEEAEDEDCEDVN